jgi:hypothetical protein
MKHGEHRGHREEPSTGGTPVPRALCSSSNKSDSPRISRIRPGIDHLGCAQVSGTSMWPSEARGMGVSPMVSVLRHIFAACKEFLNTKARRHEAVSGNGTIFIPGATSLIKRTQALCSSQNRLPIPCTALCLRDFVFNLLWLRLCRPGPSVFNNPYYLY